MKRKNSSSPSSSPSFSIVKNVVGFLIIIFILLMVVFKCVQYFKSSPRFRVKEILLDSSLHNIKSTKLSALRGRNIFDVNLKALQKQLQAQYPEITQVRLIKKFPDKIYLSARRRIPFAIAEIKSKSVLIDPEGVVLAIGASQKDLPVIKGTNISIGMVALGVPMPGPEAKVALSVLRSFRLNKYLSTYKIQEINASNLSQIEFFLTDSLKIIIDQTNITQKLQLLSFILSQAKLNLEEVNYIDLRFNEPIIGKKNTDPKAIKTGQ